MNYLNTIFRSFVMITVTLVVSSCTNSQSTGYFKKDLSGSWFIQSADSVLSSGQQISIAGFALQKWYPASIPSTVLHALVENGVYKNIFKDMNLKKIPVGQFHTPWWYRTEFSGDFSGETVLLDFDGINYKANIWLNGKLVADTTQVKNTFLQYQFNISRFVKNGKNILAVEVFPPKPGDYTIGFFDWNPKAPDGDMGIFRPVFLETNKGVGVSKPFVVTNLSKDLSQARLTASVEITNYKNSRETGEVTLKIDGNLLIKSVSLEAGETKEVVFTPKEFPLLKIDHPKLWWPYTLGTPYLYYAVFVFRQHNKVLDSKTVNFGIRTVSSYFTKAGFRGFKINGKKILIRGGGWTDRLLLDGTPESIKAQLEYVKNMGLNTIRLEGFWGNSQTLYNLSDQLGIMVMVGWSCQWEWKESLGKSVDKKYGGILSPSDMNMMSHAWQDQIIWLRNHPSIFVWLYGSDKMPNPTLEKKYLKILTEYDSTRVHLASANELTSLDGPTGVKMRGPYAYEPPVYWFSDTLYGGAFGFNTETGPGAQVPPLESLLKMFSPAHYWPIDSVWNYHCSKGHFHTLNRYVKALTLRYGKARSLADFAKKAQVLNYELMRPMFEAFSAHRYRATGVIQWMLNSAWPGLYWQLYDYYLMPTGAYYGAKEANRPVHALYDYSKNAIYIVDDKLQDINDLSLKIKILNIRSKVIFEKSISASIKANTSRKLFQLPDNLPLSKTYFLDLQLFNARKHEIDNNFYWLSHKKDILDYKAKPSGWYYYTPSKQYADFTALNRLPKVHPEAAMKEIRNEKTTEFKVTLTNNSPYIAFFVYSAIRDKKTGKTILPVLWSDNYVSLLPGETRILTARIHPKYLKDKEPVLVVKGYNE